MAEYPSDINSLLGELVNTDTKPLASQRNSFAQMVNSNPFNTSCRIIKQTLIYKKENSKEKLIMLCNPVVVMVKSLVKHVELLWILKPLTEIVLNNVFDVYEFYVYGVLVLFTPRELRQVISQTSSSFEELFNIHRMKVNYPHLSNFISRFSKEKHNKAIESHNYPVFNKRKHTDLLTSINEKIVAIESCRYGLDALYKLKDKIEVIISNINRNA